MGVSNSVLYALVLFAAAGTAVQWVNIWHILNKLDKLERDMESQWGYIGQILALLNKLERPKGGNKS